MGCAVRSGGSCCTSVSRTALVRLVDNHYSGIHPAVNRTSKTITTASNTGAVELAENQGKQEQLLQNLESPVTAVNVVILSMVAGTKAIRKYCRDPSPDIRCGDPGRYPNGQGWGHDVQLRVTHWLYLRHRDGRCL